MSYKVAVVGATGNVGRQMLAILAQRRFPAHEIVALASPRSAGKTVLFDGKEIRVDLLDSYDFAGTDLALFSAGGAVAREWAPRAAQAGCVVIDNSSHFRLEEDVPLVVPEVNGAAVSGYTARNLIANPNCSTIQLVMVLAPLHAAVPIRRVVVSTYQSVSGAGQAAQEELRAVSQGATVTSSVFPKPIAFNVIPHIDVFMEDGSTREEWKMMMEAKKILGFGLPLTATCVRVPSFVGHGEAVNIEFERPVSVAAAREILGVAPGCRVVDERRDGGYATPVDCAGEDATFISRVRADPTVQTGLNLWVVADNLRKGAALNAVQIAEALYGLPRA